MIKVTIHVILLLLPLCFLCVHFRKKSVEGGLYCIDKVKMQDPKIIKLSNTKACDNR